MEHIISTLNALLGVVTVAEQEAEQGKDFARMVNNLRAASTTLVDFFYLSTLDGVEGAENVQGCTVDAHNALGRVLELAQVGQADREEGDRLAARVSGMIAAELFAQGFELGEWTAESASGLVTRWQATAPKKSRGASASRSGETASEPDFSFPLVATCVKCNKVASQEGERTGHARWNSLRHYAQVHHQDKHGGKFSKDTSAAWKDARKKIADGATSVTAGDYTISRRTVVDNLTVGQ